MDLTARMDQASAYWRDMADMVAGMAETFISVGADPNHALTEAIHLMSTVIEMAGVYDDVA